MAIATQADVESRLQIDFTLDPEPVITDLIEAAQGHVEREYGGPLEEATYTDEAHTANWKTSIFLLHHPVTAVTSVTEDGTALVVTTDFVWDPDGTIQRVSSGYQTWWRTRKVDGVLVTYDAGYAAGDIPADIVDVAAWMVANAFQRGVRFSSDEGGSSGLVTSESIDGYSVSYANDEAANDPAALLLMTQEQRDVVRSYRLASHRLNRGWGVA